MDKQIKVEKIYIFSAGDPSVGIFEQQYEVGSDFYFEDENDLNEFKKMLKETFEFVCENPQISTKEEIDEEEKRIAEMEKEIMIPYHDENIDDEPITDEELEKQIKKDWSLRK